MRTRVRLCKVLATMKPSAPLALVLRAKNARSITTLGALALAGLLAYGAARPQDAAELTPMVQLNAGIHLIHAEVADNDSARMRGLMFRQGLAPNHGMLFVFDRPEMQCMWMRNTLIALSVAFLDDDGTVVNIEEMKPQTDESHCARRPVRYALEMSAQWFSRHGITPGSRLQGIGPRR